MSTPPYRLVIFDLDGTLVDSRAAVSYAIQETLAAFGIDESDGTRLLSFIGPSLTATYGGIYGLDDESLARALKLHSAIFKEKGIPMTHSYPGIPELIAELKKSGAKVAVATTKTSVDAEAIIEQENIGEFDCIIGASEHSTTSSKDELVAAVLASFPNIGIREAVMVGDRKYDWQAAACAEIDSIAVTYGYGSSEEVVNGFPTLVANSVGELANVLL
jgi:phosphoglycolate phosphatase